MGIAKSFDAKKIESKWYQFWNENKYFNSKPNDKLPYTIVIPPPNVTGILHMGHMLNNTIQDILIRKARLQGFNACWVPGTDHASIATEAKVVEKLKNDGIDKKDITRDEFINYAWDWTEKHGGLILEQLKKLGCSCDWDRTKFTLDKEMTESVIKVFVNLYEKGLIYRGHRMVNWDPQAKTTVSDEEVIHKEVDGHLWYFKYPVKDEDSYLIVATTRPETMLGDSAVAINPNDGRYKAFIGKKILLPLVGREIPIIADDYVDPEFGTGCVKITPAHDPNDFAMGKRHDLEFINVMNDDATINENVPKNQRLIHQFY